MIDKSSGSLQVVIKVFVLALLLSTAFVFGTIFNQNELFLQKNMTDKNSYKNLNAKIEVKLIETHSTQYIEKPMTEIKYVERIKTEQIKLYNFSSLDELINWLDVQKSTPTYYLCAAHTNLDCDDYANQLQKKALEDGYIMSFQVIEAEKYNNLFEMYSIPLNTLHAINLVLIENSAYYIEPQTGEVQFAAYLD